jgi:hypothetical protein
MESEKKAEWSPHWPAETRIRLFGQMFEWSYRYLGDRSGSEKLTQSCYSSGAFLGEFAPGGV